MYKKRYAGQRGAGPSDVFSHEPVFTGVVVPMAATGMSADLILDLLGIENADVEARVRQLAPTKGEPDLRAALREWAERHAFEERRMSKTYASACGGDLAAFVAAAARPGDEYERKVRFRVNREIRAALLLWLKIDQFVEVADKRESIFESLLQPVCTEEDRWLAHMVQRAFEKQLGLPTNRLHDVWREAVNLFCERPLPTPCDPGQLLSSNLLCAHWEIIQRDIRPFIAPMWPDGSGDRVRASLRSRAWDGEEAAEVAIICDSIALSNSAHKAYRDYVAAKGGHDEKAAKALANDLLDRSNRMYLATPTDQKRRAATRKRIAAWLAEAAPDLIELVRPCGDPLNARFAR